jgi:hypothetical protein
VFGSYKAKCEVVCFLPQLGYSELSPGKKDVQGKGFHTGEKKNLIRKVARFY